MESVSINSERENIDSVMVMPTPYNGKQLIEVQFRAGKNLNYVLPGIWGIEFEVSGKIKCGVVDMWLPTIEAIGLSTGFLRPSSDTTATIPATAFKVLSVGAYNQTTESVAAFSEDLHLLSWRLVLMFWQQGTEEGM